MLSRRQIPFFNYPALFASHEQELMQLLRAGDGAGRLHPAKDNLEFEANLQTFLDVRHAIGVADGTNALKLGLLAAGVGQGDEVIVPAHTYIASAAAIHFVGAQPMLCECGPDHLDRRAIGAQADFLENAGDHAGTAQRAYGEHGRRCCSSRVSTKLHVIEGCSAGAWIKDLTDVSPGPSAPLARFSFYPAKVLRVFR